MCGGTISTQLATARNDGLSPRVRGNPGAPDSPRPAAGSIPACAGEPVCAAPPSTGAGVYPRVCGGTRRIGFCRRRIGGLSPRVRGNRRMGFCRRRNGGSIPACAGEPFVMRGHSAPLTVYPRVCGGTDSNRCQAAARPGLSPRVRGNRSSAHAAAAGWGVYPRVCGGTVLPSIAAASPIGLSPRVRGNRWADRVSPSPNGSIPACAGEPVNPCQTPFCTEVYPRVCGGTDPGGGPPRRHKGLSPRVRGNRLPPSSR